MPRRNAILKIRSIGVFGIFHILFFKIQPAGVAIFADRVCHGYFNVIGLAALWAVHYEGFYGGFVFHNCLDVVHIVVIDAHPPLLGVTPVIGSVFGSGST